MDHVISSISNYLDTWMDVLRQEWKGGKGQFKKLSDCPSYGYCKAMVDAIHVLEKCIYGEHKTMTVKEQIEW